MDRSELVRKIRTLEIRAKGISRHLFSGDYHSAFKGKGMSFSEVREYQPGDDVRTIDWNVTARTNTPHIKVFEEERELTVLLMIDVSGSLDFGSKDQTKKDLALEMVATLAFSAVLNNDKVGALFFSDRIEQYIAPDKGRKHVLRLLSDLYTIEPKSKQTSISSALQFVNQTQKKRAICFLISDMTDQEDVLNDLKKIRKKHDLIAVQLSDEQEYLLPEKGLYQLFNAETGQTVWLNASDKEVRKELKACIQQRQEDWTRKLSGAGIDLVRCQTNEDLLLPLMRLFKHRS